MLSSENLKKLYKLSKFESDGGDILYKGTILLEPFTFVYKNGDIKCRTDLTKCPRPISIIAVCIDSYHEIHELANDNLDSIETDEQAELFFSRITVHRKIELTDVC